jgi:glycosyltransferase involved in cell wall biosynthesis
MMSVHKSEDGNATIWALVALPPPVTGMTLLTEKVVQRLQRTGDVCCYDWSPKKLPRGWRFRAVRAWRVIRSMGKLLATGRVQNGRLYVAANYRAGLWLTMILAMLGHRLGYRVFLHHHTYRYIDRFDRRMDWICSILGERDIHVVACEQMEHDFRRMYPAASRFAHVNPSLLTGPIGTPRTSPKHAFTLGHLSNLSHAKGIDKVLDTFRALHPNRREIRLKLAGPFYPGEAQRLVTRAVADFPEHVEWIGPVFGQEKLNFFNQIDCFLFPTRSESWGIVLNEAMAAGVPVIASDRGCIRTVVGDRAGIVVDRNQDFTAPAAEQVLRWIENPEEYQAASSAACEQASSLQREADEVLEQFVDQLSGRKSRQDAVLQTSRASSIQTVG